MGPGRQMVVGVNKTAPAFKEGVCVSVGDTGAYTLGRLYGEGNTPGGACLEVYEGVLVVPVTGEGTAGIWLVRARDAVRGTVLHNQELPPPNASSTPCSGPARAEEWDWEDERWGPLAC